MPVAFETNGTWITRHNARPVPRESIPQSFQFTRNAVVGVRLLLVIILSALLPALWMVFLIRRRRASKPGCCPACGYDLRATPGRCPECGAVPEGVSA